MTSGFCSQYSLKKAAVVVGLISQSRETGSSKHEDKRFSTSIEQSTYSRDGHSSGSLECKHLLLRIWLGRAWICRDLEVSACQGLAVSLHPGPEVLLYPLGQDLGVSPYPPGQDLAVSPYPLGQDLATWVCQGLAVWAYPDPGICRGPGFEACLGPAIVQPLFCPLLTLPRRQPTPRLSQPRTNGVQPFFR